jgi:hypothetical protein
MLQDREAYEAKLDMQLARWQADLDRLKTSTRRIRVDGMMAYDKALDDLQEKHGEATAQLHDLKLAGDEAWESLKNSTEHVWVEFKALFSDAKPKD